jgi:hypothetical protein
MIKLFEAVMTFWSEVIDLCINTQKENIFWE